MDRVFSIEATLTGELGELYAGLIEEFEARSDVTLSEMNRTLLQTGMIQHLTMMGGLGLFSQDKKERIDRTIDSVASKTIMWDLVQHAREFWQNNSGSTGAVDLNA